MTLGLALPAFERDIARGTKTQKDRHENAEEEQGNTETCVVHIVYKYKISKYRHLLHSIKKYKIQKYKQISEKLCFFLNRFLKYPKHAKDTSVH